MAEQVMHNGLSVNSSGPGKGAKDKRAADAAARIRDARKAARDPKATKA
jgi:hypothetical protein